MPSPAPVRHRSRLLPSPLYRWPQHAVLRRFAIGCSHRHCTASHNMPSCADASAPPSRRIVVKSVFLFTTRCATVRGYLCILDALPGRTRRTSGFKGEVAVRRVSANVAPVRVTLRSVAQSLVDMAIPGRLSPPISTDVGKASWPARPGAAQPRDPPGEHAGEAQPAGLHIASVATRTIISRKAALHQPPAPADVPAVPSVVFPARLCEVSQGGYQLLPRQQTIMISRRPLFSLFSQLRASPRGWRPSSRTTPLHRTSRRAPAIIRQPRPHDAAPLIKQRMLGYLSVASAFA